MSGPPLEKWKKPHFNSSKIVVAKKSQNPIQLAGLA
jgi:hypothetical protein